MSPSSSRPRRLRPPPPSATPPASGTGCAFLQTSGCRSEPVSSLVDATSGYLSLLDADFDRRPANPHLAKAVNYTVRFQAVRCLLWDAGEWASGGLSPQPGTSPERVSCRYGLQWAAALSPWLAREPPALSPIETERPEPLSPRLAPGCRSRPGRSLPEGMAGVSGPSAPGPPRRARGPWVGRAQAEQPRHRHAGPPLPPTWPCPRVPHPVWL